MVPERKGLDVMGYAYHFLLCARFSGAVLLDASFSGLGGRV